MADIREAAEEVCEAREAYRRTYLSSCAARAAAHNKFFAAYATSQASIMEAEFLHWKHQGTWDHVVRLLRGDSFFANGFPFDQDMFYPPELDWVIMGLPPDLFHRNSQF